MQRRLVAFTLLILTLTAGPIRAQEPASEYEVITPENADRLEPIATYGRGVVGTVARWSPDGETLAVTGTPGIWLFDADDLDAEPELIDFGSTVTDLAWSPNSQRIAGGNFSNVLKMWDFSSQTMTELDGIAPVTFSPDGTQVAYLHINGPSDKDLNRPMDVRVLDLASNAIIHRHLTMVPFERGTDLEYAPDGKTLYLSWTGVGCYNSEAYSGVSGWRGYNTLPLNRDEIEAIFGGEFPWGGIDFSLDGRWSAVNGYWGIGIWDQINQRYFLKTSNSTIQGEVFSEDGRWVVLRVLGAGAETQIFKLPEGEDFDPEHPPEPALTIERSVYGEEYDFGAENRLAAGTSVWDIETGEHLGTTRLSQFFTHPDADYIVEITPDLQAIIRDLATGAIRMTIQLHQEYLYTMKLFPESVLLPVAEKERILYSARTGQPLTGNLYTWTSPVLNRDRTRLLIPLSAEYIPEQELEAPIQYQVIDTSTGEVVSEFALQAAISTDDGPKDIIGFATSDDELRFWDFQTETFLPFRLPGARDWDITIDPEDRVIVALNYDNQRGYTWDLQTGEMLPRLNDVSDNYLPSLDADSMRLTTFNSFERLVHVYDLRTGKEIASREFPNTQYLGILTISGEVVHIQNTCWERFDWNFVTDELITEVDVPVQRAAGAYDLLSPNSALGLIYDNDQVTLWDVAEDRPVTLLNTSGERVGGLEFTADGRFLIGRNAAQQVMVWGVPAAE